MHILTSYQGKLKGYTVIYIFSKFLQSCTTSSYVGLDALADHFFSNFFEYLIQMQIILIIYSYVYIDVTSWKIEVFKMTCCFATFLLDFTTRAQ